MGFTVVYWNHTKHEVSSKHVEKIYTHLFKGNIYILRFGKQKRLLYVLFCLTQLKVLIPRLLFVSILMLVKEQHLLLCDEQTLWIIVT